MNWDAIGAIGQVLGSIAVFVTLGYLAVQVRHARHQARRALSQRRNEAVRQLVTMQADTGVAGLEKWNASLGNPPTPFVSELMERAGMTYAEAVTMMNLQLNWWLYRQSMIPYVDELTAPERHSFDRGVMLYSNPTSISGAFYETYIKSVADPYSLRYIENVLAQPG